MAGTLTSKERRRYPLATVVLMGVAMALMLLLFLVVAVLPYLPEFFFQYGAVLPLLPPVLFFVGALVAPFSRSASKGAQAGWLFASGACALLSVGVTWRLGVLIFGP